MTQRVGQGAPSVIFKAILLAREFWAFAGDPPPELPIPIKGFLVPKVELYAESFLGGGHRIVVRAPSYSRSKLLSTLRQTNTMPVTSRILVHHNLNLCYTRYATAVELGNIIAGKDEPLLTRNLLEHLAALAAGMAPELNTALFGEAVGQALAIELLVPMAHAPTMDAFLAERTDALEVATKFRVPQVQAEWLINGGWAFRKMLHDAAKGLGV